ncbi:MAG: Nif3-like dinuclear metal center hexameric protein [Victivallaceae bacterium]
MTSLKEITKYLDELLKISSIPADHSNNGLQVEATNQVNKALFAVDASGELFERAATENADFVFVHHGISWGSEPRRLTGMIAARLSLLFNNGIALYAAHLPLDAHPEIGHNALLAEMAGLSNRRMFGEYDGAKIGVVGETASPVTIAQLAGIYEHELDCESKILGNMENEVQRIGIISGGGGLDGLMAALDEGAECFITGEIDHTMFHVIKESGINVIGLGHYNSEKPGIIAVMNLIRDRFELDCEFVDIPTGM